MNSSKTEEFLSQELDGIAKVVDGDTIIVNDKRIRLIGIDAPEMKQECLDGDNNKYLCGVSSKDFLFELIDNKEVKCFYATLDLYKRYLAKCFIEDLNINETLVKEGMAVVYTFGAKDLDLILLEQQAKEDKIGVWKGAFEMPKDYRKSRKHKKQNKTN